MLTLHLNPIFKARGIQRPYAFLVKAGIAKYSAHKLVNGSIKAFHLQHIETLCRILTCEPSDLLKYTPDLHHPIAANHPLNNLIEQPIGTYMSETIVQLPLKELKALNKEMSGKQGGGGEG